MNIDPLSSFAMIQTSLQAQQGWKNQLRSLEQELRFNLEILNSYNPNASKEDLSELAECEESNLSEDQQALYLVLSHLKTDCFKLWLASNHNLDQMGYVLPFNHKNGKVEPLLFWEALSRHYNRIEYLLTRLEINRQEEAQGLTFRKVMAKDHFPKLVAGFLKALEHLSQWKKTNPVLRTIKKWGKKPLEIKHSKGEAK